MGASDRRSTLWPELAAVGLLLSYGALLALAVPEVAYTPVNLAVAGIALLVAHRLGVSWEDLGLSRSRISYGLRLGALWVLPAAAGVGLAVAIPLTRGWFADETIQGMGTWQTVYHALVRVPFGTALAEELLFRGALLGLLLRRHRPAAALAVSSVVFGLWHVVSTVQRLEENQAAAGTDAWGQVAIVGGAVVFTTIAGMFFGWLRLRSGSILAPWLVHSATNLLALGAARCGPPDR